MDLNQLLEAINKATTELRNYVDKQLDEVRKTGASHEATTAAVEKANAEITELRKLYDEAVKASQRPPNEKREGADPEVELRRSAFEKVLRYGDSDKSRSRFTADELRLHLALGLFQAQRVTLGQGAAIAAVSQSEFLHELGRRRIAIHYDEADLTSDIAVVDRWEP